MSTNVCNARHASTSTAYAHEGERPSMKRTKSVTLYALNPPYINSLLNLRVPNQNALRLRLMDLAVAYPAYAP